MAFLQPQPTPEAPMDAPMEEGAPAPDATAPTGNLSPEFLEAFKALAEQFPDDVKTLVETIKSSAETAEGEPGEGGIPEDAMDYTTTKGGAYIPEDKLTEMGTRSLKGFMPKQAPAPAAG